MKFEPKKISKKTVIIISALVICFLTGLSYAFLVADIGPGASVDTDLTVEKIDRLVFDVDKDLTFSLTQFNFTEGGDNKTVSSIGKASLTANSTNNTASYTYNVYLSIDSNEFIYTTSDKKPEMILTVISPTNTEIKSIEGLTYNSTLGGFDVTDKEGLFTITNDYAITSNSSTTATVQNWTLKLTFINLDTNQAKNGGKTVEGKIIMQEAEKVLSFANYLKMNINNIPSLIKHDSTLSNGDEDENYRYSGANYVLTEKASVYSNVNDTSATANGVIKKYCSRGTGYSYVGMHCASKYIKYYYLAYDTGKKQYSNYLDVLEKAIADGYLKDNVNNYVCFGTDATTCENDNLYRIIGVFDNQVKLIKADYANNTMLGTDGDYNTDPYYQSNLPNYKGGLTKIDRYYYNYNGLSNHTGNNQYGSNNWETSLLKTTNLNTNYINYLNSQDTKWVGMIADTKWNIGGNSTFSATAKSFYNAEKAKQTATASKIGLMSVSDYGYAALSNNWGTDLYYDITALIMDNNWMYTGMQEWTITPNSSNSYCEFHLNENGQVYNHYYSSKSGTSFGGSGVRPVFYLKDDVYMVSGTGTKVDSYRIAYNG